MNLQPSEVFDFFNFSTWLIWRQRFERFRIVSQMYLETEPIQISPLIYCVSKKAENVLKTITFS